MLHRAPVLAVLCTLAALVDLLLNRTLLRALGDSLPHGLRVDLARWGGLPRNLTAIAGVVAFTAALYGFLRLRYRTPLRRRMAVAAFSGIFLPTVVLATIAPSAKFNPNIVFFGTGAAHVLVVLLALSAVRWPTRVGLRIGLGLAAAAAFFALGYVVIDKVSPHVHGYNLRSVGQTVRRVGEVGYLGLSVCLGASIVPSGTGRRTALARGLGLSVAVAVAALVFYGRAVLRPDFGIVLYGAQGVTLLLDSAPALYAVPLGIGFGVGAAAAASASTIERQGGMGLLLFLAAGYTPQSPAGLLMMAVGMLLLGRAAIAAAAERMGQAEQQQPAS